MYLSHSIDVVHQDQRRRALRWQERVQLLTLPGQALGLADTVSIAEHGTAAGAGSDEEEDAWSQTPPVQELPAPQYDAQQVGGLSQSSCSLSASQSAEPLKCMCFDTRDAACVPVRALSYDAQGYVQMAGSSQGVAGRWRAKVWAQAAAYMAARMPACYAAVYKVLEELSMRLPAFAPESMLDFGAGPGTAIWAAHEVHVLTA